MFLWRRKHPLPAATAVSGGVVLRFLCQSCSTLQEKEVLCKQMLLFATFKISNRLIFTFCSRECRQVLALKDGQEQKDMKYFQCGYESNILYHLVLRCIIQVFQNYV